jgi:hypothetical protein
MARGREQPATTWRKVTHSALLDRILALRERMSEHAIADAFLASLSTRRLDWRSALASWAHVKNLPLHEVEPVPGAYSVICLVCGALGESDAPDNPESLARLLTTRRMGATGFPDLMWSTLDLEDFATRPPAVPSSRDVAVFRDIIEFLGSREPGETSTTLVAALGRTKLIAGNKNERAQLVDTLGLCGILRVPHRPAPLQLFTPGPARELPPHRFIERSYPVCWWRGADGVNLGTARALFGHRVPL